VLSLGFVGIDVIFLFWVAVFSVNFSEFQWTFPALTGILSLAYFIHNAVISIVRNQRHPENNVSAKLLLLLIFPASFYVCFIFLAKRRW